MEREEIMQVEAGREMDALVAEQVMGWEWDDFDGDRCLIGPDVKINGLTWIPIYWPNRDQQYAGEASLPEYSKKIAHAWEVVEKMNEHFKDEAKPAGMLWLNFCEIARVSGGRFWRAKFGVHPNQYIGVADTAPLAICRAALLTAGREE